MAFEGPGGEVPLSRLNTFPELACLCGVERSHEFVDVSDSGLCDTHAEVPVWNVTGERRCVVVTDEHRNAPPGTA